MQQSTEHQKLQALIGKWHTQGKTVATDTQPSVVVDATDTYEWLHGGYGLLHTVEAGMGENRVQGAEIIGWQPEVGKYVTQYFGSDGPNSYQATLTTEEGALVWKMNSAVDRFKGVFNEAGDLITGHWERVGELGEWEPWMDITLTKM